MKVYMQRQSHAIFHSHVLHELARAWSRVGSCRVQVVSVGSHVSHSCML